MRIAEENDNITAIGLDPPRVEPHFREFTDDSPAAEVYILGHILHDWSLDRKRETLTNVSEAVNPGGTVIVYGTMIDEERREAEMSLPMNLNMVVETPNGFDYTPSQCLQWLHETGFEGGEARELPGPETMGLARKQVCRVVHIRPVSCTGSADPRLGCSKVRY